jgi:hypothetical protein
VWLNEAIERGVANVDGNCGVQGEAPRQWLTFDLLVFLEHLLKILRS